MLAYRKPMNPRRWEDVAEERLNAQATRRMLNTRNLTVAKIVLKKGAVVPLHHHLSEQITMLESGKLLFRMDGQEILVEPGQMLEIAPDLPHEVLALEDSVATDLFSPRRQDWIDGDDTYLRKAPPETTAS